MCYALLRLLHLDELHLKDKCRASRDDIPHSLVAVRKSGWDDKLACTPHLHTHYAHIPPLDNLAGAKLEGEACIAMIGRGIKDRAVSERPNIIDGNRVTGARRRTGTNNFIGYLQISRVSGHGGRSLLVNSSNG